MLFERLHITEYVHRVALHETDGERVKPFVLSAPVERILRIIGTIPGVNLDLLIRRYLVSNVRGKVALDPKVTLAPSNLP